MKNIALVIPKLEEYFKQIDCEIRNIQMYFKWGFIKYIKTDYEYYSSGCKVIVNYYEKTLK